MKLSKFNVSHNDGMTTLVMNARGGGILCLDREYTEKLCRVQQGRYEGLDDLVRELQRGGMLIDDNRDEYTVMGGALYLVFRHSLFKKSFDMQEKAARFFRYCRIS